MPLLGSWNFLHGLDLICILNEKYIMKNFSRVPYLLVLLVVTLVVGSLGTLGIMRLQEQSPTTFTLTPPALSLPSPTTPSTTTSAITGKGTVVKPTVKAPVAGSANPVTRVSDASTSYVEDQIMREVISDYWFNRYSAPSQTASGMTDLDVARWSAKTSQFSIPTELMSWPTKSASAWTNNGFTVYFSSAKKTSEWFPKESIEVRLNDGYNVNLPIDALNTTEITCPGSVSEDLAFAVNYFAIMYPKFNTKDYDDCSHVKTVSLGTNLPTVYFPDFGVIDEGTLNGYATLGLYRPALIILPGTREQMLAALKDTRFSTFEIQLGSNTMEGYNKLFPIGDKIINSLGSLKINVCAYEGCY